MVRAIVRPWRAVDVIGALDKGGIRGVTSYNVRGAGVQGGNTERYRGTEFGEKKLVDKMCLEVIIAREQVQDTVDIILQSAQTGEIGDGKIFVLPVADVIRIRTGETGEEAERMTGGRYDMTHKK